MQKYNESFSLYRNCRQKSGLRRSDSMPRRGENIYKRRDGRWEGRYIADRKPDGKAIYHSVYG